MLRVHITGASGSGTTTLGRGLAERLGVPHHDADAFYWAPTRPPFQEKVAPLERDARLAAALDASEGWVLSGSIDSWDPALHARFTQVVFLDVPSDVRVPRLRAREEADWARDPAEPRAAFERSLESFLAWAASYETGALGGRHRARHETWLATLACPVLRPTADGTPAAVLERVVDALRPGPSAAPPT